MPTSTYGRMMEQEKSLRDNIVRARLPRLQSFVWYAYHFEDLYLDEDSQQ